MFQAECMDVKDADSCCHACVLFVQ